MPLSSWPVINPINQKNYYTEYLKRDEQYLAFRGDDPGHQAQQAEAAAAAAAPKPQDGTGTPAEAMDVDGEDLGEGAEQGEPLGSKTVILHPGSQNLRIGFGSDALPKTVPMVIARRSEVNESEMEGAEPRPRRHPSEDAPWQCEKWFPPEWGTEFTNMSSELKQHMRNMKLRIMPNNKELVVNYNRKVNPDIINEHNDPLRIEWTEVSPSNAPDYICGAPALRIPDDSKPQYRLKWPIRNGWFNEQDYESKNMLMHDYHLILEDAIRTQLGLKQKDMGQYECVFIIPDLYEKVYGITTLAILLRGIGFRRACFIQESVAATYGAGYLIGCIVDIGAQKTSISCVEDGMIIENSRINMKYGGWDVTDTFIKMMLYDYFPYSDINLLRRYDFLLAEELKQQHCTMKETDVSVVAHDFHLRVAGKDTHKYTFKTYDETLLAPMVGLHSP
jgi:actin-related protein 8